MPKQTFYNLSDEKRESIIGVLKTTFEEKTVFDASVKEIVEKLKIARGSFYQYFEDLEDAYFMILDLETVDVHQLFIRLYKENDYNIVKSLESYRDEISNLLFSKEAYTLYKNRYLYWTVELEDRWKKYNQKKFGDLKNKKVDENLDMEKLYYIKAFIHNLIQRNFMETWTKEEFITHFSKYLKWLKEGIETWQ